MKRQEDNIELIASENFVSDAVLAAAGSCFTNKYAEGYPSNRYSGREGRYYGGTQNVDKLEEYCCDKWREVFKTNYHVNVQPHSGSQANLAAYMSVLTPGDKILSMELESGGHLSHGMRANASGKLYQFTHYNLNKYGYIDMSDFRSKLWSVKPQMVVIGASAYSRKINYSDFYSLIEDYRKITGNQCYMMVDMAHVAGLIAAGDHPSPFGYADIITTTTHKTLRGARGGLIFCKPELAKKIDGSIFPGNQGGPLEHIIAAKAITAEEACTDKYREYIHQVVKNAKAMSDRFIRLGYKVVTGGTDNHMFLLDLSNLNITGLEVQDMLDEHNITLNKNMIPNDKRTPKETSGVRIGTPAMTTKGYVEEDFIRVADEIDRLIKEYIKQKEAN